MTKSKATHDAHESETEHSPAEMAHKIWLAGIGAYGKAFDEAKESYSKLGHNTSEMFEEFVKRGLEIETTFRDQVSKNEYAQRTGDNVSKIVEAGKSLQEKSRERFESRMDQMRSLLGFGKDSSLDALNAKIDVLMEEVASLKGKQAAVATAAADATVDMIDNIEMIDGIGCKTAEAFAKEGYTRISQLAGLTPDEAIDLFEKLGVAARAAREEWYAQAKDLISSTAPRSKADQDLLARMQAKSA